MAERALPESGPFVVALLYPSVWFGDPDAFVEELDVIRAVDPRVEVIVEQYDEPHDIRTLRGGSTPALARGKPPPLTDAQAAMFASAHAVVTLDLPFDVGDIAPNLLWVQGVGA